MERDWTWNEQRYLAHVELVFNISIWEWLEDIKDGNRILVPDSLEKAKEIVIERSRTWKVGSISERAGNKEYTISCDSQQTWFVQDFIRESVVIEYIHELFKDKVEVIKLGVMAGWI